MNRLNNRAFEILRTEVQKSAGNDIAGRVQQDIVWKRLEKLRSSPGSPASLEELRDTLGDIFPKFSEKTLKVAARANRPPGALSKITWAAGIIVGAVGALWVVNLPYPMIRYPVARVAPILLLPSYMSMDYHYRGAIAQSARFANALVEQADQLVNQPTSPEDFNLGEVKVKEAQKHLDALPVWFLGYWPQYTFWLGWQFTLDEFKSARANVGRMEAKVFQEKNAILKLNQGEQALKAAKKDYQQGQTAADRQTAIASWQAAIDQLEEVPTETLAGRTAQTKLAAFKRDFEQVAGLVADSGKTGTLIEAAQQFAFAADEAAKNPPHTVSEWKEIANLWEQAIERLQQVPVENPRYLDAQKLLAKYQRNLGTARTSLQAEQDSIEALERAKDRIQTLLASNFSDGVESRNQLISQLQGIIDRLATVKSGTTAYPEAHQLLQFAQKKLEQVQTK